MKTVLLIPLFLVLAFAHARDADIHFEDKSINNWRLLIGANEKELKYDFCRYNATSGGTQCTNFPQVASINIKDVCHCTVDSTPIKTGSITFSVSCHSNLSWCPQNLDLKYQQGSIEKSPLAEACSETSIGLHYLSYSANVILSIIAVVFIIYRDRTKIHEDVKAMRQWVVKTNRHRADIPKGEPKSGAVLMQADSLSFNVPLVTSHLK